LSPYSSANTCSSSLKV